MIQDIVGFNMLGAFDEPSVTYCAHEQVLTVDPRENGFCNNTRKLSYPVFGSAASGEMCRPSVRILSYCGTSVSFFMCRNR